MNWLDWEQRLKTEKGVVYLILNKENGRKYVGQSVQTFWARYDGGKWWKYTTNEPLRENYERFGPDAFVVNILESGLTSKEDLDFAERVYIYSLNAAHPAGYNLKNYTKDGEEKLTERAIEHSLEGKRQKRIAHPELVKVKIYTEEERAALRARMGGQSNPMYGRTHSEETREKIRAKATRRTASETTRETLRAKAKCGAAHRRARAVRQINPDTNETLARFETILSAAKTCGTNESNIRSALKHGHRSAGFRWQYDEAA